MLKQSFRRPCCCKLSTTRPTSPAFKPRRWAACLQAARNRLRWWPWFSSWEIAAVMLQTGRNEQDIAEIDQMATLHLPHRARTSSQRVVGQEPFSSLSHEERLNLAQLTFCDECPTRIDPVFAKKMGYYPLIIFWRQKMLFVGRTMHGVNRFRTDPPVDVVVQEMYMTFLPKEGKRPSSNFCTRDSSQPMPPIRSQWREVRKRDPPACLHRHQREIQTPCSGQTTSCGSQTFVMR